MAAEMILVVFGFGFIALRLGLPPLVGYLGAGFILHELGHTTNAGIDAVADLGILLLLFGIGLKLDLSMLVRPVVWATTAMHTLIVAGIIAGALMVAGMIGLPLAGDLSRSDAVLLGFALSFSSTVAAVKTLEGRNEAGSLAGKLTIGILVIQDVFAVGYLAFSAEEGPTWWAIPVVVGIGLLRPVYSWFLSNTGHGELLPLLGIALAAGIGAGGFDVVGLKPDLGALVVGALLATHPRSGELSDRLIGHKDLLLVAFFLSIGLAGVPPLTAWGMGAGLLLLIPLQSAMFIFLITRFRLRSRTALHTSLALATYSEFGLIVGAAAVAAGDLDQVWVSVMAIAVALSFVVEAILDRGRARLQRAGSRLLAAIERRPLIPEDSLIDFGAARVIVFGMGRIGEGAYDELAARGGVVIVGVERKNDVVALHRSRGRNVIRGDALDRDFWDRIRVIGDVDLIVAALNSHASNLECVALAREYEPTAQLAAIATYPDEVTELRKAGVTVARNLYEEAGQALAADAIKLLDESSPDG